MKFAICSAWCIIQFWNRELLSSLELLLWYCVVELFANFVDSSGQQNMKISIFHKLSASNAIQRTYIYNKHECAEKLFCSFGFAENAKPEMCELNESVCVWSCNAQIYIDVALNLPFY